MSRVRLSLLTLSAYAVLAIIMTYPLCLNLAESLPGDIGDPLLNTWILAWDGHALMQNPAGLFDANIFFPRPNTLAYSEHMLSTALSVLPVQVASPATCRPRSSPEPRSHSRPIISPYSVTSSS